MILRSPAVIALLAALAAFLCIPHKGGDALDAVVSAAKPEWGVSLRIKDGKVPIGSTGFTLEVATARAGFLTVLQRGTDGALDVVFPNNVDQQNRMEAGVLQLPRPGWQLRAKGPVGTGRLVAVVTPNQVSPDELRHRLSANQAPDFGADYGAASANYNEIP